MISICIPAYSRPKELEEALASCFAQTYTNLEVIVSDDSSDEEVERLVTGQIEHYPGKLRYLHNRPALGQDGNVDQLFQLARGGRLVLLHDDDLLLPNALEQLATCWHNVPDLDAAFGKQYLITHEGLCLDRETEELNERYARVPANAGLQKIPILAGILRMFPNDGFMVRTEVAQRVGYRCSPFYACACDTHFSLRLCAAVQQVWFLDSFTSKYRDSNDCVSKSTLPAPPAYDLLRNLQIPPEARAGLTLAKKKIAPSAVSGFAQLGLTRKASRIFFSSDYPMLKRLSPRGVYHALMIVTSLFR